MKKIMCALILLVAMFAKGMAEPEAEPFTGEEANIYKVIDTSIGWAIDKNLDALYDCFVQDSTFFIFHPGDNTIVGFDAFRNLAETVFMDPRFVATDYKIKQTRIHLSQDGNVAWFSCLSDDHGLWDGEPTGWEDCRWTGVLEKRDGSWKIAQMHFSYSSDRDEE